MNFVLSFVDTCSLKSSSPRRRDGCRLIVVGNIWCNTCPRFSYIDFRRRFSAVAILNNTAVIKYM